MAHRKSISVTPKAATRIREFMDQQGNKSLMVRVALLQTHCMGGAGHAYRLSFAEETSNGESAFEDNGIRFIVENSSIQRLRGTSIDYVENIESQGFIVTNPSAIAKCPCGHHDLFNKQEGAKSETEMPEMPL